MTRAWALALAFVVAPACNCSGGDDGRDAGPAGEGEGEGDGAPRGVAINELMAKNQSSVEDASGAHPDWVELKNLGDDDVDLSRFHFSDDADTPDKMAFPAGTTLPGGGYLLIFCDGDADQSTAAEPHAPFALSGDGESVLLTDADGARADGYDYPALADDESYGRLPDGTGEPQRLDFATPRAANDEEPSDAGPDGCVPAFASSPGVVVNELVLDNTSLSDEDTNHDPWLELFNAGSEAVLLDGLVLSDDETLTDQWPLPREQLAAGDYLVIFADADPAAGAHHASFTLTTFDRAVSIGDRCGAVFQTLCDKQGGDACVELSATTLPSTPDQSLALVPDGNTTDAPVYTTGTPGVTNGT